MDDTFLNISVRRHILLLLRRSTSRVVDSASRGGQRPAFHPLLRLSQNLQQQPLQTVQPREEAAVRAVVHRLPARTALFLRKRRVRKVYHAHIHLWLRAQP